MGHFIEFKAGLSEAAKDKAKFLVEKQYPDIDPATITDDMALQFIENPIPSSCP